MATTTRSGRTQSPPGAARRAGYAVAALVNAGFLYLVNRWPGWDAVGFLTTDTEKVLGWVNASIISGLVANLVYLATDPPRLKALGDLVTTAVALTATWRIWQVFPFDFEATGRDGAALITRIFLVVVIAGCLIAIVVALVRLIRPPTAP